ncbi:MAG: aminotransferase class I/II-fold pyridoxal phosphate-dependent enzyme [Candidatus Eremiobacteraeota bacterium]|nr:aminotransferase class I/II-fold pyridoxal phosphate-dependent enzyme [Candidatus Eremiobacteraeota bacterium]
MTPHPVATIEALPSTRPFIGPEELARTSGHGALLRLGANESAFGASAATLAAMRDSLAHIAWYGDPESTDLREALAQRLGCAPHHLIIGSGIDDLLALLVRTYVAPGNAAVATAGSYPTFAYHVAGVAGRLVSLPYETDGTVRLEAIARTASLVSARIAYVANPDSPSGSFAGRAAIEEFRALLPRDCLLVLDEAYAEFAPQDELLAFDASDPRIVRTRTFSKVYGLAGARIGYVHGHAQTIAACNKIRTQYGVNRVAQAGALAALADAEFVADVVRETAAGRADYHALARRLGLGTLPSQTNFVCIDLGSRERAEAMVAELLRRAVFVRKPVAAPLDGHIRVTVGTASERALFASAFEASLDSLAATIAAP